MTSARSTLSLVSSALMGRWSDSAAMESWGGARKIGLMVGSLATPLGLLVAATTYSIQGMWVSMIPGALFQQTFNIIKALFSDYHDVIAKESSDESESTDQAASVGLLGMAPAWHSWPGHLLAPQSCQPTNKLPGWQRSLR
jgi:hypothetical protein